MVVLRTASLRGVAASNRTRSDTSVKFSYILPPVVPQTLLQAIRGEVVVTEDLMSAINAVYDARVPRPWVFSYGGDEISWMSASLGLWFSSFTARNDQLTGWLANGRPPCFWLTGFFNPQVQLIMSTLWTLLPINVLGRHGRHVERAPCTTSVSRLQPKRSNPVWRLATADKRRNKLHLWLRG